MKTYFGVARKDRVMWAFCVAAYVLMAEHFSPLAIIRADLDDGSIVEETPFGASPQEDSFIMIMAVLAMYAALNPDSYVPTCLDQIPEAVLSQIAGMLRDLQEKADHDAVLRERDRLLGMAAEILRGHHMHHLRLAAALMQGPITTEMIQALMEECDDKGNAA